MIESTLPTPEETFPTAAASERMLGNTTLLSPLSSYFMQRFPGKISVELLIEMFRLSTNCLRVSGEIYCSFS